MNEWNKLDMDYLCSQPYCDFPHHVCRAGREGAEVFSVHLTSSATHSACETDHYNRQQEKQKGEGKGCDR